VVREAEESRNGFAALSSTNPQAEARCAKWAINLTCLLSAMTLRYVHAEYFLLSKFITNYVSHLSWPE
jgi:hypothetical protein